MKLLLMLYVMALIVDEALSNGLLNLITVDPDTFRNASELITSKGYPVENYIVETADGYLLHVERIPYGKNGPGKSGKRPVVFLMHGFLCTSSIWVWNFPDQSLGFILADNGYDVWLGNTRGNTYSRHHVYLSPNQPEFWNYSFDEMAKYDIPAMVDFVLERTGQNKLNFIGHSQGTTVAFALLSENLLYNKKIKFFVALAPVTQTEYIKGPAGLALSLPLLLTNPVSKIITHGELLPHTPLSEMFSVYVCGTNLRFICVDLVNFAFGRDNKQLNYTRLPVYFNHIPAGASVKEYVHFAQMKYSDKFQKFDYHLRNPLVYGQLTPPEYDISKITTPVALLSSTNDKFASPEDVAIIRHNLHSMVDSYVVPDPNFNHGDFVWAINAYSLVYKKVLSLLDKHGKD